MIKYLTEKPSSDDLPGYRNRRINVDLVDSDGSCINLFSDKMRIATTLEEISVTEVKSGTKTEAWYYFRVMGETDDISEHTVNIDGKEPVFYETGSYFGC